MSYIGASKCKSVFLTIALMMSLVVSAKSPDVAIDLPRYYPATFDAAGFLQSVDYHANTIMIDALAYRLVRNIPVHTIETQFGSLPALRGGMEVGFNLQDAVATSNERVITELWVLPAGSVILD